jgi:predicted nucleic acid-binding Zn ribbon protein
MAKAEVREGCPTSFRPAEARVVRDETRPQRCLVCGRPLPQGKGPGRLRRTCSHVCRNSAQWRQDRGLRSDLPRIPHRGRRTLAGLLADSREGEG